MKLRTGFVSNSSSCSFLVVGVEPQTNSNYVRLSEEQIEKVTDFLAEERHRFTTSPTQEVEREDGEPVWLTTYFSDGSEEDCIANYEELCAQHRMYIYEEGNHGRPYYDKDENGVVTSHVIIKEAMWNSNMFGADMSDAVWLKKEHI